MEPRDFIKGRLDELGLKIEDVYIWGLLMRGSGTPVLHCARRLGAACGQGGNWTRVGLKSSEANFCSACSWNELKLSASEDAERGESSFFELARVFANTRILLDEEPRSWEGTSTTINDLERGEIPVDLVALRFGPIAKLGTKVCERLGNELLEWVHREALAVEMRDLRVIASSWEFSKRSRPREMMLELVKELENCAAEPSWVVVDVEDCDEALLDPLERVVLTGVRREGRLAQLPDALFRRLDRAGKLEDCPASRVGTRLDEHEFEALGKLYDPEGSDYYNTPESALEVLRAL